MFAEIIPSRRYRMAARKDDLPESFGPIKMVNGRIGTEMDRRARKFSTARFVNIMHSQCKICPSVGLDAVAYSFFAIRPAPAAR